MICMRRSGKLLVVTFSATATAAQFFKLMLAHKNLNTTEVFHLLLLQE